MRKGRNSKFSNLLKKIKRTRKRSKFSKTKILSSLNSSNRRQYRKLDKRSKKIYLEMVRNQFDFSPNPNSIDVNELHYEIIDQIYRQGQYYREAYEAGTDEYRCYVQKLTPGQNIDNYNCDGIYAKINKINNAISFTDYIKDNKKNKRGK